MTVSSRRELPARLDGGRVATNTVGVATPVNELSDVDVGALAGLGEDALRAKIGDAFLVIARGGEREPGQLRTRAVVAGAAGIAALNDARVVAIDSQARSISVGRARTCDVVVDDNSVSTFHCAFVTEAERFSVHDGGSKNGTFVNGLRAPPRGSGDPLPVKAGAVIKIGGVEIIFADARLIAGLVARGGPAR